MPEREGRERERERESEEGPQLLIAQSIVVHYTAGGSYFMLNIRQDRLLTKPQKHSPGNTTAASD